jgi:hypothetical protein
MSRRRSRPSRDPDRRPTPPRHPGFAQFPLDVDTDVCALCRALVPATELARMKHQEWDQRIVALLTMAATIALTEQVSKTAGSGSTPQDPGSAPPSGGGDPRIGGQLAPGSADASTPTPDSTSEAGPAGGGGRDGPTGRGPASDTTSPTARGGARPTGPREPAGSGAATPGSKSPPTPSQEAPLSRGGVEGANVPPGSQSPSPPGPGGTNGAGRGVNLGKVAPAGTDPEQASLAAWEHQHADERDHRWWTQ